MSLFIFEVRKIKGEEFPPNTLVHLVSGVQRYIRMEGRSAIDILKIVSSQSLGCRDEKASNFWTWIKDKESAAYNSCRRRHLMEKGNPQALLDTMVVMNGIYFALRIGKELLQL